MVASHTADRAQLFLDAAGAPLGCAFYLAASRDRIVEVVLSFATYSFDQDIAEHGGLPSGAFLSRALDSKVVAKAGEKGERHRQPEECEQSLVR
jgi:hypothetical protein